MKLILHKTKNGWVITEENYISNDDVPECFVFESMRNLTAHLLQLTGETDRRDKRGRFRSTKKKP